MEQILDAAVQMRRHAPRVIRKVSPSSKAPGGAPSSHPPAPYLANLSRGPRASTPASAPNSAKRRCGHRWARDVAKPWPWVRREGATAAPPSSCHKTQSVPAGPSGPSARPRCGTLGSVPVTAPRAWWRLLPKPRLPAGEPRPTGPRALPRARGTWLRLHHPGCQQQSYFQGKDSQVVTWNLASRCSNKCFRRTWSQKLFRWTSNLKKKKKKPCRICWKGQCP